MGSRAEALAASPLPEAAQRVVLNEHPELHGSLARSPALTDAVFAELYPKLRANDAHRALRARRLTPSRIDTVIAHERRPRLLHAMLDLADADGLSDDQWATLAATEGLDAAIAGRIIASPKAPAAARAAAVGGSSLSSALLWYAEHAHLADLPDDAVVGCVRRFTDDADARLAHADGHHLLMIAWHRPVVRPLLAADPRTHHVAVQLPYAPETHDQLLDTPHAGVLRFLAAALDGPATLRQQAWDRAAKVAGEAALVHDGLVPPSLRPGSDGVALCDVDDAELLDRIVWHMPASRDEHASLCRAATLARNPHLSELQASRTLAILGIRNQPVTWALWSQAVETLLSRFEPDAICGRTALWALEAGPEQRRAPFRDKKSHYSTPPRDISISEAPGTPVSELAEDRSSWRYRVALGAVLAGMRKVGDPEKAWSWLFRLVETFNGTVDELTWLAYELSCEHDPVVCELVLGLHHDFRGTASELLDAARSLQN